MPEDDLGALPIKSLQLPTKTVAKIKPLNVKTVAELFALSVEALIAAGLIERELVELAEAARDFNVAWSTPEQARAAFAKGARAPDPPTTSKKKNEKTADAKVTRVELPAIFVDGSLRVVRRLRVHEAPSIGGAEHWFSEALVDVGDLEMKSSSDTQTTLLALLSDFEETLKRLKIKRLASSLVGSALIVTIAASDRAKALGLVDAHRAQVGHDSLDLEKIPDALVSVAVDGLLAFEDHDEAQRLSMLLLPIDDSLPENQRVWRLRLVADAHRLAKKSSEGARALATFSADSLSAPGAEQTLVALARLFADAGEPEKAVAALRRLFALEARRPSVVSPRLEALDDPLLQNLHALSSFRALFKGYPIFEAKLRDAKR